MSGRWQFAALLALATISLVLSAGSAFAAPVTIKAKVVSVRGKRVYLKVNGSKELNPGQTVIVQRGKQRAKVRLIASSSKFLLIQAPKRFTLKADQAVRVRGTAERPVAPLVDAKPAVAVGGSISIGRRTPSLQEFLTKPEPTRELVGFSGMPGGEESEGLAEEERGLASNDPSGSVEVGADGAYEKRDNSDGNISRTTPYISLDLEINRLFGAERARFVILGSARHPLQGGADWTSHREEHLQARLAIVALELDAAEWADIESFSDRIELRLGRDEVRGAVEAGVIDGMQVGLRVGPLTAFGFGGIGAASNPRTYDYDTVAWGGGLRFNHAFAHTGSLRISVAAAHERWRDEGDRGYLEASFDAQFGAFGTRGAAVYDVYSSLRQRERGRLTTGDLSFYIQATDSLRLSAGYSERRSVYTAALIQKDLRELSLIGYLSAMDEAARRNVYAEGSFFVAGTFDIRIRGEHFDSRESRTHTGFEFALQLFDLFSGSDRLSFEVRGRHRGRGDGYEEHSSEAFGLVSYRFTGEVLEWGVDVAHRIIQPKDIEEPSEEDERRTAARFSFDVHATDSLTLGGYAEGEMQRGEGEDIDLFLVGAYIRYDY
jgi:hypothetical protein